MITLQNDQLVFRFPDFGADVGIGINFQRTLRIPDDGSEYHLPPGLGRFRCAMSMILISVPVTNAKRVAVSSCLFSKQTRFG